MEGEEEGKKVGKKGGEGWRKGRMKGMKEVGRKNLFWRIKRKQHTSFVFLLISASDLS